MCIFPFSFQNGNDFGDSYDELQYVMSPIMVIMLKVEEPKIVFHPPFRDILNMIIKCFSEIIASGTGLPRVECELFTDMRTQQLHLRSPDAEEAQVTDIVDQAIEIFKLNMIGPQK